MREKSIGVGWLLASGLGFALGPAIGEILIYPVNGIAAFQAIYGAACGAIFGFFQWLVLRRALPGSTGWILASAAGFAAGFVIGEAVPAAWAPGSPGFIFGIFGRAIFGLIVGMLQWLILRGRVAQAAWWIAANPLGFYLGYVLVKFVRANSGILGPGPQPWPWGVIANAALAHALIGLVLGVITGSALVRLLRPPKHAVK